MDVLRVALGEAAQIRHVLRLLQAFVEGGHAPRKVRARVQDAM